MLAPASRGQKISGNLRFEQGQRLLITVEVTNTIAQQAMGQAIDFIANGKATHSYTVTNATSGNSTLHHAIQGLVFRFEGMGQKRSFDSDNAKDMSGPFGKYAREILSKSYDMIIDSTGKTLLSRPEKIEMTKQDERLVIITDMLKDLTSMMYPPAKGSNSFFGILPATAVGIGDTWNESINTANEKSTTVNTLSAITDSTIVIDSKTTSTTITKTEIMGMQVMTNMNNVANGTIIVDKVTGIIREKTSTIESNGTTEAMGSTTPITAKTTIHLLVEPAQ